MRTSCIVRLKPFHLQTKMFETFLSCKLFSCKDSVHVQSFAYAIHFLILVSCRTCVSRVVVWRALKTCFSYQTGLLRPSLHFPNPCSWLRFKRPIPCRCQLQCVTGNRKTRDYHPAVKKEELHSLLFVVLFLIHALFRHVCVILGFTVYCVFNMRDDYIDAIR